MKSKILVTVTFIVAFASMYSGCRQDAPAIDIEGSGYPEDIAQIVLTNCAIRGCHTGSSVNAAGKLDLTTWNDLMEGGSGGAIVIPYNHTFSTMFGYCNTYPDLGQTLIPTMPFNDDPLTRAQMITLRDWIESGAPSADGRVAFSGNPQRKKYYVANQGCDVVSVIDAETGLIMRVLSVGADPSIESPHSIRMSPDGEYWYLSFASGRYLEKYRASDDAFVGRILLGLDQSAAFGSWNTFSITPDSRYAFVVHWDPGNPGRIACVDLEAMRFVTSYSSSDLNETHGSALTADGNTLYVTATTGNFIYKFDVSDPLNASYEKVVIDGVSQFPATNPAQNAHEVALTPDGTKIFITCPGTNEVRVLDPTDDSIIAVMNVGSDPLEIAFSHVTSQAYVTCMDDIVTFPGKRGSVFEIDWQNYTVAGAVYSGHQPHGVGVDDNKGVVVVANRNVAPGGPAPHHGSVCSGKNGTVVLIQMSSFTLLEADKIEVSVDPYGCLVR